MCSLPYPRLVTNRCPAMRYESALPGSWSTASAQAEFPWENRHRTIETQLSFAPVTQAGQFFQRSGNNKWMSVTFELTGTMSLMNLNS